MRRCLAIAALLLAAFSASAKEIPDVDVVDQTGRPLHFYRDLVAQKVVVVAFFFTRCQDACPVVAHTLLHLQTALGDRLGRDVSIVSVSIDPKHDTPAVLAEWGKTHGVKPGWTLVTGDPAAMNGVTRAISGDNARTGLHSITLYLGNDRTGEWISDAGSLSTEHYLQALRKLSR
jgi:cytochrome oxidase Cu insertion factor (SCO1/SenC/PrrC family)